MKRLIFCLLFVYTAITAGAQQYIVEDAGVAKVYDMPDSITFSIPSRIIFKETDEPYCTNGYGTKCKISISLDPHFHIDPNIPIKVNVCWTPYGESIEKGTMGKEQAWATNKTYDFLIDNLEPDRTYAYCPVLTIGNQKIYGETHFFYTAQYVDLGLSVYWATANVNNNYFVNGYATLPYFDGDYYAWGETSYKTSYDYENYQYFNRLNYHDYFRYDDYEVTCYNRNDNRTTLLSSDDVATRTRGNGWRMPTFREVEELLNFCDIDYIADQNMYRVRSTLNGKEIYIPGAGYKDGQTIKEEGKFYIWTSQPRLYFIDDSYAEFGAYAFFVQNSNGKCIGNLNTFSRQLGMSIRPVHTKN